eukprot:g7151.t1
MEKIHFAAMSGDLTEIFHILKTTKEPGKILRRTIKGGLTPMHLVSKHGHREGLKMFLENQGDPLIEDSKGRLPIHYAARYGHCDIVNLLLDTSPKSKLIERKDKHFGQTSLHYAAAGGHDEVILLLLKRGAKADSCSFAAETPADIAAFYEHKMLAQRLRKLTSSIG